MKLSAVVLTKNEEKNIDRCLKSLQFCDEVVVIDDSSIDESLEKAKKYAHMKILEHQLKGDFAAARNFGMEKASGDWVLFVDADEEVSEELKNEIQSQI